MMMQPQRQDELTNALRRLDEGVALADVLASVRDEEARTSLQLLERFASAKEQVPVTESMFDRLLARLAEHRFAVHHMTGWRKLVRMPMVGMAGALTAFLLIVLAWRTGTPRIAQQPASSNTAGNNGVATVNTAANGQSQNAIGVAADTNTAMDLPATTNSVTTTNSAATPPAPAAAEPAVPASDAVDIASLETLQQSLNSSLSELDADTTDLNALNDDALDSATTPLDDLTSLS